MTDSQKILSFDIGIRNLAWCLMEKSGTTTTILGWQNYDLLTGQGAEVAKVKVTCIRCSVGAAFTNPVDPGPTCARHCPATHPPLKDLSGGTVYKRIPDLKTLRTLTPIKGTRVKLLATLAVKHSIPLEKVKVKKKNNAVIADEDEDDENFNDDPHVEDIGS